MKQKQIQIKKRKNKKVEKEELRKQYKCLIEKGNLVKERSLLEMNKILTKAYILGKKINGTRYFGQAQLAIDFEITKSYVRAALSLNRATPYVKKMMKEGKITPSMVARIIHKKGLHYQDEIVEMVVKHNLTKVEVDTIKITDYDDVQTAKAQLAMERGYAHKQHLYRSVDMAIKRFQIVFMLSMGDLSTQKRLAYVERFKETREKLDKLIKILDRANGQE